MSSSTYASNGAAGNRQESGQTFAYRIGPEARYLDLGLRDETMIPTLETERMWLQTVRLKDAEQVQRPQWDIVRHLGAVVPWPYPADGALRFYRDVAMPQMERGEAWTLWL
jgi:hypothetical protein